MGRIPFDYAVIVALDEEARYFSQVVSCAEPEPFATGMYLPISDPKWAAFGRGALISAGVMGCSAAYEAVRAAVTQLHVRLLFNIGIAGRIDETLRIGDVVVPDLCLDVTERSKIGGSPDAPVFLHAPRSLNVPGGLVPLARAHLRAGSASLGRINSRLAQRFSATNLLSDREIRVAAQPVCCVPNVCANDAYRCSLQGLHRNLAAMDLESAGIIEAAQQCAVALLCVRGISDDAAFNKAAQESLYRDENRRLAFEAATAVVETTLAIHTEKSNFGVPKGLTIIVGPGACPSEPPANYKANEALFSLLVRSGAGDLVDHPIREMVRTLCALSRGEQVVLLGEKGSGKTSLFRDMQHALTFAPDKPYETGATAVLLRLSEIEHWHAQEIDSEGTRLRLELALEYVAEIVNRSTARTYLLVDGLNRTGNIRVDLVNEILRETERFAELRLAISAETSLDLQSLYRIGAPLKVTHHFRLEPMDIEDEKVGELITRFGAANGGPDPHSVLRHMRAKDVRSVDIFMLAQFHRTFTDVPYRDCQTLSECYELLCAASLAVDRRRDEQERRRVINEIAETAFEIFISKTKSISAVKSLDVARLISSHSSIAHYLVAIHVVTSSSEPGDTRRANPVSTGTSTTSSLPKSTVTSNR